MDTLDKLIDVLELQKANVPKYTVEIGSTAADLTAITNELANLKDVRAFSELVDQNKKAITQIKQSMFNGDPDEPVADVPDFPAFVMPFPAVAGCLQRAIARNKRFKLGPGYVYDIGVALGIEGDAPAPKPPADVKPTVELHAAAVGYVVAVVVTGREKADSYDIYELRKGSAGWTLIKGGATGKSIDIVITPTTPGDAQQVQLRVQCLKNNLSYGQPSDPVFVTANP